VIYDPRLYRRYVCRERISQIMMLNWLAPEIQRDVLMLPKTPGGRFSVAETTLRAVARSPQWAVQRSQWGGLGAATC